MNTIDWIVLASTLTFIVSYGVFVTKGGDNVNDFIRGGSKSKWWTIGLSVMATQASAITFLSTPGQAFHDGMGFVQLYFGIPIAMVIICLVFIPLYHRLKIFTAYEFLENRFDLKTRVLTASLFLIQRGLAAGITIYAPAIILSAVLGWNLIYLNIAIGILVIIYTVSGGTKAVSVTQKHQMAVIFTGMFIAFFLILSYLPDDVSFSNALDIANINGKMDILDFSFDFENRYTVWSGLIGGTFLMLSYFGTDQSQVQRYLSGKSVREMQLGLVFNGVLKVPMQFFILLVGIMVFVFYQFNSSPINFNPTASEVVLESNYSNEYQELEDKHTALQNQKQKLINQYMGTDKAMYAEQLADLEKRNRANKEAARLIIDKVSEEQDIKLESNDKDYVFIHFILNNLPNGLIGLLLAVILSAAMSSTASELNALASTTTIDLYKRAFGEENNNEMHYVNATKWFTAGWGVLAIIVACLANLADNLIQLVNIIGSIFYGNVLGIFLIAFFIKFIRGNTIFIAAILTQVVVIIGWWFDWMPFLWLNLFGCLLVMLLALSINLLNRIIKNKSN